MQECTQTPQPTHSRAAWALGQLGAKEYADELAKLLDDHASFDIYKEDKKDDRSTSVSEVVAQILKAWELEREESPD